MDVIDVQQHLKGADSPATGGELADVAENEGAPRDVVRALEELGDRELDGPDDLMAALTGRLSGDHG
jgi:hypothetical protein